ncbi:MAG: aspartate-semialdehyde dehydrogenase [Halanaerobiales bacterium]
MNEYNVAIVGATGAVGREMMSILENSKFPIKKPVLIASERSQGKLLEFRGEKIPVQTIKKGIFSDIDIALFSIGSKLSSKYALQAVAEGAVVIDNSNAFRMDEKVPLVVPEINPDKIDEHNGIIANPNCSTIQMVLALYPLYREAGIERLVVSTYQAVSGTGMSAIKELKKQSRAYLDEKEIEKEVYPEQIAFNVLPHIDVFDNQGYTKEERKVERETRKILNDDQLRITCTAARVPVFYGHSEAVNVELKSDLKIEKLRNILSDQNGVTLMDSPEKEKYPHPLLVGNEDRVMVGRIRRDFSQKRTYNLWIVANNLRKGAALNAVQIAEKII